MKFLVILMIQDFTIFLKSSADLGDFLMSAGATVAHVGALLDPLANDSEIGATDEDITISELFEKSISGQLYLDAIMASALEAGRTKDLDPSVLSKLWKIEHEDAVQMLDVTSQ